MDPQAGSAASVCKTINIDFTPDAAHDPQTEIRQTGDRGAAPRTSRYIRFVDDGKLFEGHLTVESRSLKSLVQYLIDHQAEQAVIIQDLQDQVGTLRTKVAKVNQAAPGCRTSVRGLPVDKDGISKRLSVLEGFVALWGARPEEIHEIVQRYGDPVITPEHYTSFLLDLPAFRQVRRDARNAAAMSSASNENAAMRMPTLDTAARRSASGSRSERLQLNTQRPVAPLVADAGGEGKRLAVCVEDVQKRVEELEQRIGASHVNGVDGFVDQQARQDIEMLGEYLERRLQQRESSDSVRNLVASRGDQKRESPQRLERLPRPAAGVAQPSSKVVDVHPTAPRNAAPSQVSVPSREPASEVVDLQARDDAAASIYLLEELERNVDKRFRELSSAIANVSLRTSQRFPASVRVADNAVMEGAGRLSPRYRESSTGASRRRSESVNSSDDAGGRSSSPVASKKSRAGAEGARKGGAKEVDSSTLPMASGAREPSVRQSCKSAGAPMVGGGGGPVVDKVAREETEALAERLVELEEEITKRWQAMEERLRIIGRATMNRGVPMTSAGPSVDRKAREDASLSLMRVQQLERLLQQLKRQMDTSARTDDVTPPANVLLGSVRAPLPPLCNGSEPAEHLKDTYNNKVHDLEKEVEKRMADVNRAIALLKGPGEDAHGGPLAALLAATLPPIATASARTEADGNESRVRDVVILRSQQADTTSNAQADTTDTATLRVHSTPFGQPPQGWEAYVDQLAKDVKDDAAEDMPRRMLLVHGDDGIRRTTVNHLRSPEAPLFGFPLVQRKKVDLAQQDHGNDGQERSGRSASVAPRHTDHSTQDTEVLPLLPPSFGSCNAACSPSSVSAEVPPGCFALTKTPSSPSTHPTVQAASRPSLASRAQNRNLYVCAEAAALGHSKPCVIFNCAWCAADGQAPQSAATSL